MWQMETKSQSISGNTSGNSEDLYNEYCNRFIVFMRHCWSEKSICIVILSCHPLTKACHKQSWLIAATKIWLTSTCTGQYKTYSLLKHTHLHELVLRPCCCNICDTGSAPVLFHCKAKYKANLCIKWHMTISMTDLSICWKVMQRINKTIYKFWEEISFLWTFVHDQHKHVILKWLTYEEKKKPECHKMNINLIVHAGN